MGLWANLLFIGLNIMTQKDLIRGKVTQVIDGDTFDMTVTYQSSANSRRYNTAERIRLAGVNAPELRSPGGQAAKQNLTQRLLHKQVECAIHARDTYSRLVADVKVLSGV